MAHVCTSKRFMHFYFIFFLFFLFILTYSMAQAIPSEKIRALRDDQRWKAPALVHSRPTLHRALVVKRRVITLRYTADKLFFLPFVRRFRLAPNPALPACSNKATPCIVPNISVHTCTIARVLSCIQRLHFIFIPWFVSSVHCY